MKTRKYARSPFEAVDASDLFLVLSDANRSRILELVKGGEKTVSELTRATRLHQPLVSHHLRVLRDAGLVEGRREGRFRLYRAAAGEVARQLAKVEEGARALEAAVEAAREGAVAPQAARNKEPGAAAARPRACALTGVRGPRRRRPRGTRQPQ